MSSGEKVFESGLTWNPARPGTAVIACVDGRWIAHVHDFVTNHLGAGPYVDYLTVPGGVEPLTLLDFVPKDFNFLKRRLEGLVGAHGTRRIVAIAHQDCAWYRERRLGPLKIDLKARQLADLERASRLLYEMFPDVAIETYFARLSEGTPPRVVFESV